MFIGCGLLFTRLLRSLSSTRGLDVHSSSLDYCTRHCFIIDLI